MRVEITLAYQPTQDELKRIQSFFNTKLAVNIDKSLIAGIVIAYKGRIYDYSYVKRVDELLEQQFNNESLQKLS